VTDAPRAAGVSISHLEHAYDGDVVLHDIDLEIPSQRSVALLGPSGCGKTTLLRLIAGLSRPRQGSIRIGDRIVADANTWVPPERRRVGMVFQDWALFPHLSIEANVGYGLPRGERNGERVRSALHRVGLQDLSTRMPATLSGGQQQRVALARALAPEPSILLLDEPFSNLDTSLRIEVRSEVHRLLHQLGITAVFVTHDQEEAFILGDEVAVMRDGHIVQMATPQTLYTEPADRKVAEFVGSGSIVPSVAHGGVASSPIGPVAVGAPDGDVDLLFRPEQLSMVQGNDAVVDLVEYYGHDTMVFVKIGDALLRVRCSPTVNVRRGDRVGVRFIGTQALCFPAEPTP